MKNSILILTFAIFQIGLFAQEKINYSESDILLKTTIGNIYGILTVPDTSEKTPLIIIIPGSGSLNRDGNMPPALVTNMYKMLSERFAENGISSLRYDKRGVGKSSAAVISESELRFENYVNDVVDWITFLKNENKFSKIILIGHSEGSLIGILAATQTNISSFISVAGAGRSVDELLREQLKNLPPQLLAESNKIIDSLQVEKTISKVNPNLLNFFRPSVQPYLISWIKYDPAIEITKLKIPVLLIQGTTDLQVTVNDTELLSKSKSDAQLVIIHNMNHVLKESASNVQQNMKTYSNPELPLKSGLIDEIVSFVNHVP